MKEYFFEYFFEYSKKYSRVSSSYLVFEQEARPTLPLVVERLYTMDCLLKDFESSPNFAVAEFSEALRENLGADNRFPQFGMRNELNCMANYLNPILRGCHLKLEGGEKFEETKTVLARSFEEWGLAKQLPEEEEKSNEVNQPEVVKKLTPTELLKQQVRRQHLKPAVARMS